MSEENTNKDGGGISPSLQAHNDAIKDIARDPLTPGSSSAAHIRPEEIPFETDWRDDTIEDD